ncbi:hypothetical protein QIS99_24635 [Streptomyces sp. B-S-A8]|uniref:B3/B4 tRNA-binding domain-containing protein n=1 Tax=Streptomyces solicavernae TaxID=3043614 RepID=A0ABT6RY44_9ACTN|nr:hypothetical protein [Streptomyces sp. B-S-A8]MDI3389359.1 hypothetical protein [Streptomyces sp. B-S-A8]
MHLNVSTDVLALGLRHVRVWQLSSDLPLLSGTGPTVEELAGPREAYAPVPPGYADLFAVLGYPDTVPAGARLRELAATRELRSHGLVVDVVSAATLFHGGGIGLHQLPDEDAEADFLVTRAKGSERMVPAFSKKSRPVPEGDLLYGAAHPDGRFHPYAWLGRRDCDAADRQLTEDSRRALLVALGCPGEGPEHTEAIGSAVARLLAEHGSGIRISEVPLQPQPAAAAAG